MSKLYARVFARPGSFPAVPACWRHGRPTSTSGPPPREAKLPSRQSCFSVGKQRTATTIEPLFFDNCVFLTGTQRRRGLAIRLAPRLAPGRVPGVGVARRPHVVTREIVVELRELDLFDQGACPAMASTRRLAAILAADVAGYSRLMGADEEGTHERLKAHLRELVDPKIGEHNGRIVKNTGDGFLAEFPSVVDAVRCAVEVQRGMVDREPEVAEEQRIKFRIGINLGDVIAEEHDIFGDGVNVAVRLEALAAPGGICLSRMVRDNVRDRLDCIFEDLGEQHVKNIARPVRVYAWRPEALADLPASSEPPAKAIHQQVVAPRLSIVVLPFTNLSNDREQQYFADAITEDLTTDLSRIENMFVISRNTAFTYRNKPIDTKQIGCELGVRYVLGGSVRRSGNQVRVSAQLIDAATDAHLWAERSDSDTGDLFAVQNEITSRLANALGVELIAAEAARPTEHPDALD